MKLQDYNFQLPEELIASFPLKERSKSKLLVLEKLISDRYFIDLPELLEPNDVLVINDTAVFKARFLGKKASGSRVEVLIERVINESLVIAQTKSNSKLKEGDIMVCISTNPSWTPLFGIVSGIISETGGTLSHTAVVAREYNIPTILEVENSTELISDNDLIEVDADKGIITIIS